MKAAVLTQIDAPLEVMDVEPAFVTHDSFCANGQVLVQILCSGICGSQLQEIRGFKGNAGFVPHLMGHEGCGVVRSVGPGVNRQILGKRVCMHWRKGSGGEAYLPARYTGPNGLSIGSGHVTTFSEMAVVSANRITVVDDDVPPHLCALLGCSLSTALGTIEQEAKLRFGESVLILGCGGLGMSLVQAAKLGCAFPIVCADIVDKSSLAKTMGAHHFVNLREHTLRHAKDLATVKGFDCVIDTTGSVEALETAVPLMADGGRLVMVGQPKPGDAFKIMGALDMFHGENGRCIRTTQGGGFRPNADIPRYVNLWRDGKLDIESIVSHVIPLSEINRGIDLVRSGQASRIMIYPDWN
jgi:S-(hydroxymethyl)glutathione dehydrogenase/alcohol dehydrogenase